ncbi:hypothetical protein C7B82_19810 [Stenomitos frigidus ULC18]|uniref:FUSC family protein n=2 Tax=Stenomitos TaxID=1844270 RepID=A0A2T1E122_9CYAN|nr:hypothetical protein C7B82_19810 [Stenomitos frigidus ULC18]
MALLLLSRTAFKTAIAAMLAFVIAQILHWEYPFYAVIAAIIVMGSTAGSTLTLSVQRLIGTAIGAIGGALIATLFGSNPLSLAGSVFLTVFLSSVWKFNEAAKLSGYISAIVILNYHHSPWLYAWGRALETLLGIGAALLVNKFIFPSRVDDELRRCLAEALVNLEQFYQLVMTGALTGAYDRPTVNALKLTIISSLQKSRELWKEVHQGQAGVPRERQVNETWEFLIYRLWEHILTMEHTILARQNDVFWQRLSPYLTQISQETTIALLALATAVKTHKTHLPLPNLETSLSEATEQVQHLQNAKQMEYPIDELLRFFTFFYTMEEVGRKLQRMAGTLKSG